MIRRCTAFAVALLLAACRGGGDGGSGRVTRTVASATVTSGDQQSGTVNTELPGALVATLVDQAGQPATFVVTAGGGSLFVGAATCDANGVVRDRSTLGKTAGDQKIELRGVDASGAGVVYARFGATALAGAPATITGVSGGGQTADQRQALPSPVTLAVTEAFGNPVPNVAVSFATSDDGVVLPASAHTDASGQASAAWTLGKAIGSQTLAATVAGLPAFSFPATSLQAPPGAPTKIALVSGAQQTVTQHAKLGAPLVVRVTDALDDPVPGATVAFATAAGSGHVTPQSAATDSTGQASWQGYFHVAGTETLEATIAGGLAVDFTTVVQPGGHVYDG